MTPYRWFKMFQLSTIKEEILPLILRGSTRLNMRSTSFRGNLSLLLKEKGSNLSRKFLWVWASANKKLRSPLASKLWTRKHYQTWNKEKQNSFWTWWTKIHQGSEHKKKRSDIIKFTKIEMKSSISRLWPKPWRNRINTKLRSKKFWKRRRRNDYVDFSFK